MVNSRFVFLFVLVFSALFSAAIEFDVAPLWERELSEGVSSVRMVGRNIFVSTGGNTISLLTTTGRLVWSKTFESQITGIGLSNNFLGVSLANGELILMDYKGERKWSKKMDSYVGYSDALLLTEDGFYVGDMKGMIYFYDLEGNLRWKGTSDAYVISLWKLEDTVLVVSDKGVYALEDGKMSSKVLVEGYVRSSNLKTELSSVSSSTGELIVFDLSGNVVWDTRLEGTIGTVYSSSEGVVAGTREESMHVFDETGTERWSTRLDGSVSKVYLNREYVIASSINGRVYTFNWRGRPIWINIEESSVSDFDADEDALVYGTSDGLVKYYVLTQKTMEQAYIVACLIGITLLAAVLLLASHWRVKEDDLR